MRKLIQKLALVAMALLTAMGVAAQTTFVDGDFLYTVLDAGENTVSLKSNVTDYTGALTIPATVANDGVTYKVTKIADYAFNNQQGITSITFEGSNLEEIGKWAFKDTRGVTGTVTIPASVKIIDVDGFCRCYADNFVFASGSQLETLGEAAFWEGKFTTMPNLPNTLTTIGNECFKRCSELTDAWLPASVTKIPYATFAECPKLTSATVAGTVTELGEAAFWSCPLLASVTFEDGTAPLKIVGRTFEYCYALTSINLPDRINQMGENMFYYCRILESAHFPTSLTAVPAKTFDCCYALSSVTGIDQVTRIERSAFGDCQAFTSFTIPAGVEYIGDYAFANQNNCASYTFAGNNVTQIGSYAFQNNKTMTSFTLPASVTSLGNEVFLGCTELTSFDLPSGVTFGTGLFSGCSKLASVNLPNDITEIPNNMFYGCSALTGKFTIPATVTRIGRDAFRACNNITEVEFPANSQLQTIDYEAFYMDPAKAQLERFIMPNTVTTLGNGALRGCKKLDWDNFHLSTQVTMLPGHVFCDCGFTQFPLEETNVTTLDFNVFDGNCFTEFHLPASVTMSSSANFYANHKLERFYFEDGCDLTEIKSNTFAYCENLNYIYLPVATPPTLGYSAMPEAKQVFMDVPAEAIATYKANSAWANFKYALSLETAGTTDLALDDASQRYWSIYEYNGLRYLYNDQSTYDTNLPNNLMSWTFINTVEKEYSLLLNACNRYYTDANDYLEISLVKYNADGTKTTVQTQTVKIDKCSNNYYAYADKYEQVLVNFDNALEVSKYAVTFKRLGSNGKFVWNAQMVPTADICIISPVAKPAGAGEIAVTGDLIQVNNDFKEITLNAASIDGADWISFANWTIDGAVVGNDATYTFTPSATTEVVANYNITPQNIPADLDNFVQTQAVLYPANPTNNTSSIYWYPNTGGTDNYVYIRDGNSATYFVKSTKAALYNLKFKTSSKNYNTSAYIVDVINADGDVIFTKQNDIAQTTGWYNDDMNQEEVAISTPLLPDEVYSVRFTFISKDGRTAEIANFNFVQFEVAAIVPDVISLNKAETTIKVSADETLAATLATTTNDAVDEDYLGVEWTSSDAAVATVDATGKVTAVAPGTATITAKATGRTDIDLTAECAVTVPQHVTDITVAAAHKMYVGNVDTLTAVAAPENAADKTLTWTSSDDAVVDVDADGKLTAKKAGTATITVTAADRNVVSKTVAVTVHQPVTGITLNETSKDMLIGQTLALTATLAPADPAPYNKNLDWTSTDTDVATVAVVDGVVTVNAVGKGTANIIATAADGQGATAQCAVTVTIPVATITMPAAEHLFTGATLTLTPTIAPANADNKAITWTSSAPEVATVDDGTVTALTAGTAVITATAADGSGVTAQTTVTVTVAVTDITINAGATKTMHKGDTFTMTATTNADATDKTVTWTSDNEAVAEVSAAGVVTAKIGGIANITATANDGSGVSATCAVTVDVPVTSVTLDQTSATVYKDVTVQLKATVNPDDATVKTVTWTSSAPAVASVSATGLVTALSAGDATITVKSDADASKFATFAIHVMSASAAGTGVNQLLFHEEVNDASFGDNCIAWNNATDKDWVANNIIITDANDYTSPYDVEAATLTYKRTFTNDSWQPLYVPFNMAYTEWCDKVDIAKISGVHEYDDGTTLIEFRTVKSGEILPNVPYIIRAKSTSDEPQEFICTNKTLSATPASDGYVWCASTERRYTLTGSYKTITGLEGALGLSSGTFYTITSAETVLKAMRFYLTITDENHGYGSGAPAMGAPEKVHIMVDDQTTDLLILGNEINNEAPAYNVQGIRVNDKYKGVIIQNGRKVLNK